MMPSSRWMLGAVATLVCANALLCADTLNLRNGNVVEGKLIGRSDTGVRFQVGNEIHFYPDSEVRSVAIAPGSEAPPAAASAAATPAATAAPTASPTDKQTILAGTVLLVRFSESVHTRKDTVGKRFTCTLETALKAADRVVLPAGTKVYGKVLASSQAGNVAGKSKMVVTLTEIAWNDGLKPIVTEELHLSGEGSGKGTLKRAGAGAAIGGAVGGGSGAAKGAAIGAAIGLLGKGSATGIPKDELLEFRLKEALILQAGA